MTDNDIDDKPQPLLTHLLELRNRLMWAIGFLAARTFLPDSLAWASVILTRPRGGSMKRP